MYLTCVRHKVREYAAWRAAFDVNAALLFSRAGCLGTHIVQMDGDPLDVAVINLWPSEKEWNDFGALHASPEFKDKVKSKEDGGVLGEPTFWAGTVAE